MADSPVDFYIGQRLCYDGALCTVRYIGAVPGTTGTWLGVEWDDPTRGKHAGVHNNIRYFTCLSNSPTSASFVRPSRPSQPPRSFLSAVHAKYTSEVDLATSTIHAARQIRIGTKMAEEVGFDKIRRQLARVDELKIVIVDGWRVGFAKAEGEVIPEKVPKIRELDVGRNLMERVGVVVEIVTGLEDCRVLKMGGNRFRDVETDPLLASSDEVFSKITELALNETLLSWSQITTITSHFASLASLHCGSNQLSSIPFLPLATLPETLTSLNLELNGFTALSDLKALAELKVLRNLHLKANNISAIAKEGEEVPVFSPSLQYVDMSYNAISTWSFLSALTTSIPGLASLRISHTPIYQLPNPVTNVIPPPDETHMLTIARIPQLKALNFAMVTPADRFNASLFYLSRIARELAALKAEPTDEEITEKHPLWPVLIEQHGRPDIPTAPATNPNFLEARLVKVHFTGLLNLTRALPKSHDMYTVKGVVATLTDRPPSSLRLIWETGEWDPVAALDDVDDNDIDDDDEDYTESYQPQDTQETKGKGSGRWLKREVELKDGTRQLGFCVDGMEVTIRVEDKTT